MCMAVNVDIHTKQHRIHALQCNTYLYTKCSILCDVASSSAGCFSLKCKVVATAQQMRPHKYPTHCDVLAFSDSGSMLQPIVWRVRGECEAWGVRCGCEMWGVRYETWGMRCGVSGVTCIVWCVRGECEAWGVRGECEVWAENNRDGERTHSL